MASPKLTPTMRYLLTKRNAASSVCPRSVFTKTLQDAQAKGAETGWLVAATCTLLTANCPSAVGYLYRFLTDDNQALDVPSAVNKAAIMRESALKSTIFVGVPRVILSLAALHEALNDDVKNALRSHSRRTLQLDTIEPILARGRSLWNDIYTPFSDKLHDKLASYHPDFISFIIQAYGSVLSPLSGRSKSFGDTSSVQDPDQGNLSRVLGSVVAIACLRAEGGVGPQLLSHTFGLLKARGVKNQSPEDHWLSSDEGAEWVLRTVDEIVNGISAEYEDDNRSKARL